MKRLEVLFHDVAQQCVLGTRADVAGAGRRASTLFVVDYRTDRIVPEGTAAHLDLAARGVTLVPGGS